MVLNYYDLIIIIKLKRINYKIRDLYPSHKHHVLSPSSFITSVHELAVHE